MHNGYNGYHSLNINSSQKTFLTHKRENCLNKSILKFGFFHYKFPIWSCYEDEYLSSLNLVSKSLVFNTLDKIIQQNTTFPSLYLSFLYNLVARHRASSQVGRKRKKCITSWIPRIFAFLGTYWEGGGRTW